MKNYRVQEGTDEKWYCVEFDQNGFFNEPTGDKWQFSTKEFAQACVDLFTKFEQQSYPKFALNTITDTYVTNSKSYQLAPAGFDSGWKCELFGCGESIVLYPKPGKVPNWFWRKMQYLILGHEWKRTK